jgi:putative membrane protein
MPRRRLSEQKADQTYGGSGMNIKMLVWVVVFISVLTWSAIEPADRLTWWMEVIPAMAGFVILVMTRKRFPLTELVYFLILVHAVILMVGGHYTYAEVPIGDWLRDLNGGDRNDYDKLGHLAQGFIPALIAREIMIRNGVVAVKGWLTFLVVCIVLAFSAFYELIEWWAALVSGEAADSFLGTQGYVWDTQSDMLWALSGAILALMTLSKLHDRQISLLTSKS